MADQIISIASSTLSPDPHIRREAEKKIIEFQTAPNYGPTLLQACVSSNVDENVRLACVLAFKNFIKSKWNVEEGEPNVISEENREQIKTLLVKLLLSIESNRILQQLSASLSLICQSDFPNKWQGLLPEFVERLKSGNMNLVNRVLHASASIFKRFRLFYGNETELAQIQYVLDQIQVPLLEIFKYVLPKVTNPSTNPEEATVCCTSLHLVLKIFISLSTVDLPAFFEDNLETWMNGFLEVLKINSPQPVLTQSKGNSVGVLYKSQSCICDILNIFTQKHTEEFVPYANGFVQVVWGLLVNLDSDTKYDSLVTSSIRFLCSISKSSFSEVFNNSDTLKTICERVVLPHLYFRDSDEELFEFNYVEYIRRDIEGSDSDTRRKIACDFVKSLRTKYENLVTQIFSSYIMELFKRYESEKTDWKSKDAAIYLVTALAVKTSTTAQGTIDVNPLVPVGDIFAQHILPELNPASISSPVIVADCLKFTVTFRNQIPVQMYHKLFPILIQLANSESAVVHTYAAHTIEKFLLVRDKNPQTGVSKPRFGKAELAPHLEGVMNALFRTLQSEESKENEYVMKAILRCLVVCDDSLDIVAQVILPQLVNNLSRIYKNPTNPHFNHYIFECVGLLIKKVGKKNQDSIPNFLNFLFPVFEAILNEDIVEFVPYIFQLMAVLLEVSKTIPNSFLEFFPNFVSPQLWSRTGNIPPLVRLLQAYLSRGSEEIVSRGHLDTLLGISRKLTESTIHDHEGFFLLESIIQHCKVEALQKVIPDVFKTIFTRLTTKKTTKFVRGFLVFLSMFICTHGPSFVIKIVDSLQPNLFGMILNSLWIPDIPKVNGVIERKLCAYASILLLGAPETMTTYQSLWSSILKDFNTILHHGQDDRLAEGDVDASGFLESAEEEMAAAGGLNTTYSRLIYSSKDDEDPFPGINPSEMLKQKINSDPQFQTLYHTVARS